MIVHFTFLFICQYCQRQKFQRLRISTLQNFHRVELSQKFPFSKFACSDIFISNSPQLFPAANLPAVGKLSTLAEKFLVLIENFSDCQYYQSWSKNFLCTSNSLATTMQSTIGGKRNLKLSVGRVWLHKERFFKSCKPP